MSRWQTLLQIGALLLLTGLGCNPASPKSLGVPGAPVETTAGRTATLHNTGTTPAWVKNPAEREEWRVHYLGNERNGYGSTTCEPLLVDGRALLRWQQHDEFVTRRGKDLSSMVLDQTSTEAEDGDLVSFAVDLRSGPSTISLRGHIVGKKLQIEMESPQGPKFVELSWEDGVGGFNALTQSLRTTPLKAGETRQLEHLEFAGTQVQVVDVKLTAADQTATTTVLGKEMTLLPVNSASTLPDGNALPAMTLWLDPEGRIWKSELQGLPLISYRTDLETALAKRDAPTFDILEQNLIPLDRKLPGGYECPEAKYAVEVKEGNPLKLFPTSLAQKIQLIDDHHLQLTVRAISPDTPVTAQWPHESTPPTAADTEPSRLVQSDDSLIKELASAAAPQGDAWPTAQKLEAYVHRFINRRDFTQAFASAADVARERQGDCTEHAVLLAALARARGIPARVAVGLLYLEQPNPAFGYHMWTEVYIGDRWIGLDAMIGRGGVGATHLKLGHSSLSDSDGLAAMLPVIKVMGQLKFQLLEPASDQAPASK